MFRVPSQVLAMSVRIILRVDLPAIVVLEQSQNSPNAVHLKSRLKLVEYYEALSMTIAGCDVMM